jgi:UPF0716 protein FxsA
MPILFFIFIVVPIIEIAIFIQAGDWFGLGPTLFCIVLTAFIGITLIRQQGLSTLYKAQQKMNSGEIPAIEMIEGLMIAVAGAFLITPGFFTDSLGFLLLLPLFRQFLVKYVLRNKIQMQGSNQQAPYNSSESHTESSNLSNRTIEGEFKNNEDE